MNAEYIYIRSFILFALAYMMYTYVLQYETHSLTKLVAHTIFIISSNGTILY